MYKNRAFLFFLATVILLQFAHSQNNTNSPYTRFGYGDLSDTNSGEQRAMGGVSLGSHSKSSINTVNPASYSSVDSMTFMFDLGTSALISRFSNTSGGTNRFTANLEYITMQFPLVKNMGFSAGLLPYSFVGYNYSNKGTHYTNIGLPDFDSIPYRTSFSGSGGLSQVYAGLSAKLFNHVSLGVNTYYMYGTINNQRVFKDLTSSDSTVQKSVISAANFRLRYGLQFQNTFNKKHDLTLGVIYENKAKLKGNSSQINFGTTTSTIPSSVNDSTYELPTMYGVGLYYTFDKRLSLGVDYTMQEWGNAKFRGVNSLINRSKLALGVEYLPNPKGRKFVEKISYRGGLNVSDAYYLVNNAVAPKNYGVSVGLGLPLYNSVYNTVTMLNTSFEYGKVGSMDLLREDYFKFTLSVTVNERWFMKRKL